MEREINQRGRLALLLAIMILVAISIEAITFSLLYRAAFDAQRDRLVDTAQSQARLIEAIARYEARYSPNYALGATDSTLTQLVDAHNRYQGFGRTGEFTLSRREGDHMVFLLKHRHYDLQNPKPVPFDSKLAEPMRLALSGESGTVVGLDYRGQTVLAAHEPVAGLGWGIVAKIDLSEIRAPFVRAGVMSGLIGMLIIILAAIVFASITNPILEELEEHNRELQQALDKVNTLKGLVPICASCKKIRDDKGYWNHLETYISKHSEAEFSHGLCPDCLQTMYPDLKLKQK